jgi:hypothetical protein
MARGPHAPGRMRARREDRDRRSGLIRRPPAGGPVVPGLWPVSLPFRNDDRSSLQLLRAGPRYLQIPGFALHLATAQLWHCAASALTRSLLPEGKENG